MNEKIKISLVRIEKMEARMNDWESQINQMNTAVSELEKQLSDLQSLYHYYYGPEWREDLALDEQGQLPEDLRRGVLSEDGLYNLFGDTEALAENLYSLAKQIESILKEQS